MLDRDRIEARPFLSIVTRTQGRRPHTLVEVLTCLTAQTDTDFEVLLLGHRLDAAGRAAADRAVSDTPQWMRNRIRLVDVEDGNRTRPLNVGFAAAQGDYIAVLDDDDAVFGHWVETFRELARGTPGNVLRAMAVLQSVDSVTVQGQQGLRAEGAPDATYPATFDVFDHILENRSPTISVAVPGYLFRDWGVVYDETLTTTEDWDFLMRCVSVAGITTAAKITSIYRWWNKGESSRTDHDREEWRANQFAIWDKWNNNAFTLPAGSFRPLVALLEQRAAFRLELRRLHETGIRIRIPAQELVPEAWLTPTRARDQVRYILTSNSWRVSAPFRIIAELIGLGNRIDLSSLVSLTPDEAEKLAFRMRETFSWRITMPLRWLKLRKLR